MTCPEMFDISPSRWRDKILWGSAAAIVFFAHVASATWIATRQAEPVIEDGPPPAIMIEMAALPEAINTQEQQLSEDMTNAPDVAASQPQPEPPPQMVTQTIPTPEPPQPTPLPEPVVEQEVAKLVEKAEVPLPPSRPVMEKPKPKDLPKPKKVEVRKEPPKERKPEPVEPPKKIETKAAPSAPSKAAMVAAAQVDKGQRNAASQTGGSGSSGMSPARWQSKLQAHLERRKKRLSRNDGQSGTVTVRFSIDTGGNVLSASVAGSSGNPSLDSAVVAMVRSASPVPAPPPDVGRTVTVPIRFDR